MIKAQGLEFIALEGKEAVVKVVVGRNYSENYKVRVGPSEQMYKTFLNEIKWFNSLKDDCGRCKHDDGISLRSFSKAKTLDFFKQVRYAIKQEERAKVRATF